MKFMSDEQAKVQKKLGNRKKLKQFRQEVNFCTKLQVKIK